MRVLGRAAIVIVIACVVLIAAVAAFVGTHRLESDRAQAALADFYAAPDVIAGPPGTVIRTEPMAVALDHGTALRVLYVTQTVDDQPTISSGMVFIPSAPAPAKGRPVVAWAHGTVGLGDACAPSRTADPIKPLASWLDLMLERGWVVTATDYAGLGTAGDNLYLVGKSEARDVVNSVRAARNIAQAHAGSSYAVWGHSQGGNAALWVADLSQSLAPELDLIAAAAAAPAARLDVIMDAQWPTVVAWVIGPPAMISWKTVEPSLELNGVVSASAQRNAERIARTCIEPAALEGMVRDDLGQDFFVMNPIGNASWTRVGKENSPTPPPAALPTLIVQSTSDEVVLPWPNAELIDDWCGQGATLDSLWLGDTTHMHTALSAGPSVVQWIAARFAGVTASSTCGIAAPSLPHVNADGDLVK